MEETLKGILLEEQTDLMDEGKLQSLIKTRFDEAKKIKDKRVSGVSRIKSFLDRLTDSVNTAAGYDMGKLDSGFGDQKYISPIATTIIEKKCASDWVPDLTFEPEERFGVGSDIYLAKNSNRVFSFGRKVGKFRKACQEGSQDLFEKGRMVLQMGFMTRTEEIPNETNRAEYPVASKVEEETGKDAVENVRRVEEGKKPEPKKEESDEGKENREYHKATFIRFKNKRWESVYWTMDEHSVFIIEEFSLAELIDTFGEDVKGFKVHGGDLYQTNDEYLDFEDEKDLRKSVQVAHHYNDSEKIYTCQIGGQENFYKKMTNDLYPFTDEWGDGYIPVTFIDASAIKRDGHPISDLDKILPICINYDQIFQAVIRKAKKNARSKDIIGSINPKKQRKQWLQDEANELAGLDTPHFMKVDEGTQLFAKSLDVPFDLNSPMAIREAFTDEIMMATGVNLRLLGTGAETARQEELRLRRELEVIDEMIKINEPNWEQFALNFMQMLKNVEADFYDEYVAIEDEISERNGVSVDGTVRDIMDKLEGFPFNVRVSVNQSNAKRKSLEIAQKENALNSIAPFAQGSPAVARMAYNIAEEKFPGLRFTEEDFLPQAPPESALGGGGAMADLGGGALPAPNPQGQGAALPPLTTNV